MHIRDMIARWRLARRETLLYLARVSSVLAVQRKINRADGPTQDKT